jgi:acylphosphatase
MSALVRLHGFVYGKVQGVWMRAHTEAKAKELNLAGWVRNIRMGTNAGSVEVTAEGDQVGVDALLQWLHEGSPMAHVEKVEHTIVSIDSLAFQSFNVHRKKAASERKHHKLTR